MTRWPGRRPWAVGLAVALALIPGCGGSDPQTALVRVAAASDLQPVLDLLEVDGVELQVTYGSSGTFLQQLVNGAPYDLYLSADATYPRELVDRGLADAVDVFPYAEGRLVLWVPDGSPLDPADGLGLLADSRVRNVAIANPEHAPYGRAAVAAMRAAGVERDARPKLVLGENVAQAADFVASGGADVGLVAKSAVLSEALGDVGRWADLPSTGDLDQAGVVLRRARDSDAARSVRDALTGAPGRDLLQRFGFDLPER